MNGDTPAEARAQSARIAALANLPNTLTLTRIAAIPMIVWLLHRPTPASSLAAFVVFFVASLTDYFDGWLARRYALITPLGKLLDPLADKLLIVSALLMIAAGDRQPTIPAWLLVVIIGRELAVTGLRSIAAAEGVVLGAEGTGKLKMILQIVGVHALILHYEYFGVSFYAVGMATLVAATAVGLWSAVEYHVIVFRELVRRAPPPA
jgi:CDP-diacylglycerol--glycerol-3-phosphate 3-phosphatidyltransferase